MDFQYKDQVKKSVDDALSGYGYMIAISKLDANAKDNELSHMFIRENFPIADIIPSLDTMVRSLGVVPTPEEHINYDPKIPAAPGKPLKIAIMTHMSEMRDSYSPANAVKRQIKMLKANGHSVVLFVQEISIVTSEMIGCEVRKIVPSFSREKNIVNNDVKNRFIHIIRHNIEGEFDVVITHDFYLEDCITYREAFRESGVNVKWIHWARSAIGNPIDFNMPNSKYVYMNFHDKDAFAEKIFVDPADVRVVFNEKDPTHIFNFSPFCKMVVEKFRLWDKDIIQTFPICSTRMDAKGINSVISVMAALKRAGKRACLIVCNSNGQRRLKEIGEKMDYAKSVGLDDNDIVFTSSLASEEFPVHLEVENSDVISLMRVSNLFVFPSVSEVCNNSLLEASLCKNLLVINQDLPSLNDFVEESCVIKYPFSSVSNLHYSHRDEESMNILANVIIDKLDMNDEDIQFRRVWANHNAENIYNMLSGVLYE